MEQYYKIAGLVIKLDSFGRTAQQAENYKIDSTEYCDFTLTSRWPENKANHPEWDDKIGEYMFTGADFYKMLLDYDGLMLHSSVVVVDGKAYLFSADSGTGTSTHTQLWLKLFGDRAYILTDDKPALRLEDGVWYAYGTPWSGKNDISVTARIPIAGIAMLERDAENSIERFGGVEAIRLIMAQLHIPKQMDCRIKLMELLDQLITMVPIWRLKCNMDLSAAQLSYNVMSGAEKENN